MNKITSPVMRYHGGKFRLAPWIMSFFPEHATYVEPFGGTAGVMIQKEKSMVEVYNDLDNEIVNVFRVLQNKESAAELIDMLLLTPYSRAEFQLAFEPSDIPVEQARRTLIRAQQGFGSAGATKGTTGFRIDTARKYGTSADLWARMPSNIKQFCERFMGVVIENKDAISVIENHDRADTLYYVDPPYVHSTRSMRRGSSYRHELTDEHHLKLMDTLKSVEGMVILSGYQTELYDEYLPGWASYSTTARISAGRGTKQSTEVVWLNPACFESQCQQSIFHTGLDVPRPAPATERR